MTAQSTPRLGLMSPVDSDTFSASDFANTFAKLDGRPGILPVANYAAMNALNWGVSNHGSVVLQLDNSAMWFWNNPSGSGSWSRINAGSATSVPSAATQLADVTTGRTTGIGVLLCQTGAFTVAGGSKLKVSVDVNIHSNYEFIWTQPVYAGLTITNSGSSIKSFDLSPGGAQHVSATLPNLNAGQVANLGCYLVVNASGYYTPSGNFLDYSPGASVTARGATLSVSEV